MVWCHLIMEAFCMYNSLSKKQWKSYKYTGNFDLKDRGEPVITQNRNYIPKNKRPKWCLAKNKKKTPQYKCLKSNCPFFAYTNAMESDYKLFDKAYGEVKR